MPRRFNVAGPCKPELHYMLPAAARVPQARRLVADFNYFVIHAPRQTGKTTSMNELAQQLTASGEYVAVLVSVEVGAAFNPVYDTERYGARLVASPRHADVVLVTGVVTHNMAEPLRRTVEATPRPRLVLAVGDCAHDCGVFRGAFGVRGSVADVVDVDLVVPGCPPEPAVIVQALRRVCLLYTSPSPRD